jgi:2,5-furandicarboxylate decarboxylase 1
MNDLGTFLKKLAEFPGELLTANGPVSPKLELTRAIYKLASENRDPAVLYTNVDGSRMPVVSNLFRTRKRMAIGLGCSERDLNQVYRTRERNYIKPTLVATGPIQEVVRTGDDIDLGILPVVTHNTEDGGPYITAAIGTTVDPASGIRNAGMYRLQVLGKNRTAIHLAEASHVYYIYKWYCALGQHMPIALTIGAAPAVYLGSLSFQSIDVDEYDVMGGLLGKSLEVVKCRTVDHVVPAHGEICLEGYIDKEERVSEGPFGEFPTLYGGPMLNTVFKISAMTMRKAPIYMDVCSGSAEHQQLGSLPRIGQIQSQVKMAAPGVKDVYLPLSAFGRNACYVSIEKMVDGEPANVAAAVFSADPYIRHVVVVDSDVNVFDESDVLRAISLYMRPENCFMMNRAKGSPIDPTAKDGMVTKIGIDATKPHGVTSRKIRYSDGLDEIDLKKIFGGALTGC